MSELKQLAESTSPDQVIHTYHFNSIEPTEIGEILGQNLPSTFDMLDTYPEEIQKTILNHTDISKLLSPYGMNYQTMNVADRIKMNQTIQKNITAYQKKLGRQYQFLRRKTREPRQFLNMINNMLMK